MHNQKHIIEEANVFVVLELITNIKTVNNKLNTNVSYRSNFQVNLSC